MLSAVEVILTGGFPTQVTRVDASIPALPAIMGSVVLRGWWRPHIREST